jgi:hypothetical protein
MIGSTAIVMAGAGPMCAEEMGGQRCDHLDFRQGPRAWLDPGGADRGVGLVQQIQIAAARMEGQMPRSGTLARGGRGLRIGRKTPGRRVEQQLQHNVGAKHGGIGKPVRRIDQTQCAFGPVGVTCDGAGSIPPSAPMG